MNFYQLIDNLVSDTLGVSLVAFRPELVLCGTIVVLLLLRMFPSTQKIHAFYPATVGLFLALMLALPWQSHDPRIWPSGVKPHTELFTGMLVFDQFSVYMRSLLLSFAVMFTVLTKISGVPDRESATDFFVLVLGALLGMCLMVSANHMLIVLLGIEMASVPSYVLAGMLKHRRTSSEAALKYAVFGAGTAGVMLYGISLLVGTLGSAHLPTMAGQLAEIFHGDAAERYRLVLVLGGLMLMVGLAFKLSAVPFHFWAPDVFEGATAEVAAFLSIASKAASLGLLVRLALGLGYAEGLVADLAPVRQYIAGLLTLLAAVTCTFGNLAAYGQTNIKRLLAYSTIAHAGYLIMPVAAAVMLCGTKTPGLPGAQAAVAAMAFYLAVYVFMNLGAFATVAFLRNDLGSEQIADYAGLIRRSPGLAVCFSLVLVSLVGIPPLAGFAAKFTIFASLLDAKMLLLLGIGALNTVLSLFYYLRVIKVMVLEPEASSRPAAVIPLASIRGVYCLAVTLPLLVLGIWWNGLFGWASAAARLF